MGCAHARRRWWMLRLSCRGDNTQAFFRRRLPQVSRLLTIHMSRVVSGIGFSSVFREEERKKYPWPHRQRLSERANNLRESHTN